MRKFLGILLVVLFMVSMCGTALAEDRPPGIGPIANVTVEVGKTKTIELPFDVGGGDLKEALVEIVVDDENNSGVYATFGLVKYWSDTVGGTEVTGDLEAAVVASVTVTGVKATNSPIEIEVEMVTEEGSAGDHTETFNLTVNEGGGGSSSSGCDTGLGFLALALLGAVPLVLRRK